MVVVGTLNVPFKLNLFVPSNNCSKSQSFNINIAKELIPLLQSYSSGDFETTSTKLQIEEYEKLVTLLNRFDQNTVLGKILQTFFNKTVQGIQQSIFQYTRIIEKDRLLNDLSECAEVMDDYDKLVEYLGKLKQQRGTEIFTVPQVTIPAAVLRPEYMEYCILYGLPSNGIFDTEKLHPVDKLVAGQQYLIAVAAYLGKARLIDNVIFTNKTLIKGES